MKLGLQVAHPPSVLQLVWRNQPVGQRIEGNREVIRVGGCSHVDIACIDFQVPVHLHRFAGILGRQNRYLRVNIVAGLDKRVAIAAQVHAGIDHRNAGPFVSYQRDGWLRRLIVHKYCYGCARDQRIVEGGIVETPVLVIVEHDVIGHVLGSNPDVPIIPGKHAGWLLAVAAGRSSQRATRSSPLVHPDVLIGSRLAVGDKIPVSPNVRIGMPLDIELDKIQVNLCISHKRL